MTRELLTHRDPSCAAGFTATTDRDAFGDRPATEVELRCWACGTRITFSALTPAVDDPAVDDYAPPVEHVPYLGTGWGGLHQLAASIPPEKVGRVYLHVEHLFRGGEPMRWLVADPAGNVLGEVAWYLTPRLAVRYGWDTPDQAAGRGEGFATPTAAARALAGSVYACEEVSA